MKINLNNNYFIWK